MSLIEVIFQGIVFIGFVVMITIIYFNDYRKTNIIVMKMNRVLIDSNIQLMEENKYIKEILHNTENNNHT